MLYEEITVHYRGVTMSTPYSVAPPQASFPRPPRLHWIVLFILSLVTLGLFGHVWAVVQANWSRKIYGRSNAFVWLIFALIFFVIFDGMKFAFGESTINQSVILTVVHGVVGLGLLICYFAGLFTLRSELQRFPIQIPLSGVMTFFFGALYFQFHLHDYTEPYIPTDSTWPQL